MKRTWSRRLRNASMIPLMPSPGSPKTTSTPQSCNPSIRMSAAVIAILIALLRRLAARLGGNPLGEFSQVTCLRRKARSRAENPRKRARRNAPHRARRDAPRAAMHDLHGKNAFRRSNAKVKRRARSSRRVDSFAVSVLSSPGRGWHVRCCLTVWFDEKGETSHEAASHARRYDGRRSARGPRGGTEPHEPAAAVFHDPVGGGRHCDRSSHDDWRSHERDARQGTTAHQDSRGPSAPSLPVRGAPEREEGRQRDGRARAEGQRSRTEEQVAAPPVAGARS